MASDPEKKPVPAKKRESAKGKKETNVEESAAIEQPAAENLPTAVEQPAAANQAADKPHGDESKKDTKKANGEGSALENQPAVGKPAADVVPSSEKPAAAEQPAEAERQVVEVTSVPEQPAAVEQPAAKEQPAIAQVEIKPSVEMKKAEVKKPETKKVETRAPASTIKAPVVKKAPKPTFSAVLRSVFLLVLETLLPVILAAVLVWYGFGYFNFWQDNNRTAMLVLFAVALVAISLLLSIVFDTLTAPLRKSSRKQGLRFYSDPRTRVVKIALGGLLLPLAVFAAANLVTLPARGQVMNLIISASAPVVRLTPSDEVGLLALQSENPATKQLSIQVLQGLRSPEGLGQLMRLVNEDPAALQDAGVADALAKAIASYGLQAKDPLLVAFQSVDPSTLSGSDSASLSGDLYERYFSRSFESMQAEVNASTADAAQREARLAQLQAAEAQLKTTLGEVGSSGESAGTAPGDLRPDFVLRTFLAMELQQDPDLLTLARNTAADKRYSSAVRGDALLLVGKLGDKDSLNVLFPYLKETDELIQARALQAIAALQDKLANVTVTNP